MRYVLAMIFVTGVMMLHSIAIIDPQGISRELGSEELSSLPRQDFASVSLKDNSRSVWQGIRFDKWLRDNGYTEFARIRFEADDRYMSTLDRSEFDTLAVWLAFTKEGVAFEDGGTRVIIPGTREMKWVSNLVRVVLEGELSVIVPQAFMLLDRYLEDFTLHADPAPFVDIQGWYFREFLPEEMLRSGGDLFLLSKDGISSNLSYPKHLADAVLEYWQGGYHMKSPQIPGGMWLRDVVFMQMGEYALIHPDHLTLLIELGKKLDWKTGTASKWRVVSGSRSELLPFSALFELRPDSYDYFELVP